VVKLLFATNLSDSDVNLSEERKKDLVWLGWPLSNNFKKTTGFYAKGEYIHPSFSSQ
jgi:hypothetical protein